MEEVQQSRMPTLLLDNTSGTTWVLTNGTRTLQTELRNREGHEALLIRG